MSTKIYDAYLIKTDGDPWQVVWEIEKQARANVSEVLNTILWILMETLRDKPKQFVKGLKIKPVERKRFEAKPKTWFEYADLSWQALTSMYRGQIGSNARNEFDFDVSLSIFPLDGKLYLQTHSDMYMGKVFDFLKERSDVVDFHYQNQTDIPKGISIKEWRRREKTWGKVVNEDGTSRGVSLEVCSIHNFWNFLPIFDEAFKQKAIAWATKSPTPPKQTENPKKKAKSGNSLPKKKKPVTLPKQSRRSKNF